MNIEVKNDSPRRKFWNFFSQFNIITGNIRVSLSLQYKIETAHLMDGGKMNKKCIIAS